MKVSRARQPGCGITGNCTADPHPNPLPQGEGAVSASRNVWLTASAMDVPTCRSRSPGGPLSWGRGSSQCFAECLVGCFCHGMCRLAAAAWRTVPSPQGEGAVSASRNVWLAASAMECADWPQPLGGRSPLLRERGQSVPRGMSGWLLLPWNVPTGSSRSPDGPLSWGRGLG